MSETETLILRCLQQILHNQRQLLLSPGLSHGVNDTDKLIEEIAQYRRDEFDMRVRRESW